MQESVDEIDSVRLHPEARKEIKERTQWFVEILTAQSKLNARKQKQNYVQKNHVDLAYKDFTKGWQTPSYYWDLIVTFGGIIIGVGMPGFIQELQRAEGIRGFWITIYTVISVIGVFMVSGGIIAKRS